MAADLHIHVGPQPIKPATNPVALILNGPYELDLDKIDFEPGGDTDIWVGEVSWLKAALLDDTESFVPPLVAAIASTIPDVCKGTPVTITDGLIGLIKERISLAATVKDGTTYNIADPEAILIWLEQHKGQEAWTVSW